MSLEITYSVNREVSPIYPLCLLFVLVSPISFSSLLNHSIQIN